MPDHILVPDFEAFLTKLPERSIHVNRIPKHDDVDNQAERAELIFLTLTILHDLEQILR